ncbi:DUF1003 domain-containing protein [Caulobacter segnis]|uniref:DUF1003 domain-containing protein n=1 Tax=Caulobacter segnis TaxID=88688 RepID=UPI00240F71F9|nr:DUF1003 domain-containing protein [Caulobacter segnis]MDG2523575.1 DUF1003 domain-containing protein [Caulobacter segnis]
MTDNVRDRLSRELLGMPYAELSPLKCSVIDLIADEAPTRLVQSKPAFWDGLADKVAAIGGSWGFIFGFAAALILWMGANLLLKPLGHAFDPYPFIFLNLILSTLAAIQAPIIMMSQNRQAERDRVAAEHDYVVNLRAELEILRLHDRLDALRAEELAGMVERVEAKVERLGGKTA